MECLENFLPEEAMGCILNCRSPTCFASIYGRRVEVDGNGGPPTNTRPQLEPGQVDLVRYAAFDECNRKEANAKRLAERKANQQGNRVATAEVSTESDGVEVDSDEENDLES